MTTKEMKTMKTMKERFRGQLADARLRRMQERRSDIDARMERLKGELSAEKQAREEMASLVKEVGRPKKRRGLLRMALVGAAAYVLGAKAGRQRYQLIVMKLRKGSRRVGASVNRRFSFPMAIPGRTSRGMWTDRPDRSGMQEQEGVMMR